MPPSLEYLHALWVVAIPVVIYLYKQHDTRLHGVEHKQGKHGRKLARHGETLHGVTTALEEVKGALRDANEKLDRLAERPSKR